MKLDLNQLLIQIKNYDSRLYDHSIKVSWIVKCIVEQIGFENDTKSKIIRSALLHDIGKTNIPLKVLNKRGSLTESEWQQMKKHVQWGADILKQHNENKDVCINVLYHHEKWDGSGYFGLKEQEIPFASRIICLADCFEAMTAYRPYCKALNYQQALNEINRCSGSHFDPNLVQLFKKIKDSIMLKYEEEKIIYNFATNNLEKEKIFLLLKRNNLIKI